MMHGVCVPRQNKYHCICQPRYSGNNCEIDNGESNVLLLVLYFMNHNSIIIVFQDPHVQNKTIVVCMVCVKK